MQKIHPNHPARYTRLMTALVTMLILAGILTGLDLPKLGSTPAAASALTTRYISDVTLQPNIYLPILYKKNVYHQAFGVEASSSFYPGNFLTNYAIGMRTNYVRLNERISWRELQPNENDPIDWEQLVNFETELRTLRAANIIPIIIVDDYPYWATIYQTNFSALLPERYDDFAIFTQALVSRYSTPEFNVHIWELGNEPDVDPRIFSLTDNFYGCWGDWDDIFYNGRAYGNMLKVVTPLIRAADPHAQVLIGGLLLASPNTIDDHVGQPEDFLRGILEAGAAPYFDVVSYHSYVAHTSLREDRDIFSNSVWDAWGGMLRGKANFLRSIMADYGVDKPLFLTETSQLCSWCQYDLTLLPELYDFQANLPPRSFPRAIANGITGFIWYTLDGPGWYYGGLLDENQVPKPVYYAYQTLSEMVGHAGFIGPASYGDGIEAYTFHSGAARIDIIFSIQDITYPILISKLNYLAAYDRFGNLITPTSVGSDYQLNIQYEPIYLVRTR